jgi:hypothetical protein
MSEARLDHAERAEYTSYAGTIVAVALGRNWLGLMFRKDLRNAWCRRRESNPRPRDYETLALPLSYAGIKTIPNATESVAKVSSIREDHSYSCCAVSAHCWKYHWKSLIGTSASHVG